MPPRPPADLRIVPVDSAADPRRFPAAAFAGFGFPAALGARFLTRRLLDSPETALLVGYVGRGEPVATSMLMATGRVAGIYWVATIEAQRRKGYAEALTWAALDAGRSLGCTIGSLQASVLGRPVYARMGFAQTAEYVHFQAAGDRLIGAGGAESASRARRHRFPPSFARDARRSASSSPISL